jgi:DNA-binding NtrC family response regulator
MWRADDLARASFQDQPGVRQCILVVEEVCDLRQLNAEALMDAGYQVNVTEDVATAWAALQIYRYNLLVTDQFVPQASVVELITKIHAAGMALPVLMVTDNLPEWQIAVHPCLETVTTLHKPYTIQKFLGLVKKVLSENVVGRGKLAPAQNSQSRQAATSLRP